jgi:hypothetical protein
MDPAAVATTALTAKVTEIRAYTRAEAERREKHRQVDEDFRQFKAERHAQAATFAADTDAFLAGADARTAQLADRLHTTTVPAMPARRRETSPMSSSAAGPFTGSLGRRHRRPAPTVARHRRHPPEVHMTGDWVSDWE